MEIIRAFLMGGMICLLCQLLIDLTHLTPAKILTGLVVLGVLLESLGLYNFLRDWGGAGASVPLLGFGSVLAQGVREAVAAHGLLGAFTGGLSAAAGGTGAAVFFGVLAAVFFSPKDKS